MFSIGLKSGLQVELYLDQRLLSDLNQSQILLSQSICSIQIEMWYSKQIFWV